MSNTLQARVNERLELWKLIQETGGEINETTEAWLMQVEKNLATKVDSYQFIQQELASEAARLREEAKKLSSAAKTIEALSERLNDRIKFVMRQMNQEELSGHLYRYKLVSMSPKLTIDETLLPNAYKVAVTNFVPDKEKIKQELLNMKEIPGCSYESVYGLRCGINKGQD